MEDTVRSSSESEKDSLCSGQDLRMGEWLDVRVSSGREGVECSKLQEKSCWGLARLIINIIDYL